MAAFLLLLLLLSSVGALSISSDPQEAYNRLPTNFKKGVNLALEQVNSQAGIQDRFLFFKGVFRSDIKPDDNVLYLFYHFFLKATNCSNGTVDYTTGMVNSTACEFRDDIPLIDCAICYKTFQGEIQQVPKPFVYCIDQPALTKEIKRTREYHCNRMGQPSGAPCCLAEKMNTWTT